MAINYTHNFDISIGANGSSFYKGELAVDTNAKKSSQKISSSSNPLSTEFLKDSLELISLVEKLFIKYGGIKHIHFEAKA